MEDSRGLFSAFIAENRPDPETLPKKQDGSFSILEGFGAFSVFSSNNIKGNGYSPDGKNVVFAATQHLIEVDIASGDQRVIHEFPDREIIASSLSPDGKTIAVTVTPSNTATSLSATIELVSIVDGSVTAIDQATTEMGYSSWVGISWTPDGRRLVFAEDRPKQGQQLYSLDIASRRRTPIGEPVFGDDQYTGVRVHPDGDKLTFSKGLQSLSSGFSKELRCNPDFYDPSRSSTSIPIRVTSSLKASLCDLDST